MNPFIRFMRQSLANIVNTSPDELEQLEIEKAGELLTPNLRALRLTMTLADYMLSMGAPAHSVANLALGITNTYCARKVHVDISYLQITISQDRGVNREPLTLVRTTQPRATDYEMMSKLQRLASRIADRKISLSGAEKELDEIIKNAKLYPRIIRYLAGGGISAGSVALYTTSVPLIIASFVVGFIISGVIDILGRFLLPPFFTQIIAAISIILVSTGILWLVQNKNIPFFASMDPTILSVGGITLLVAGMLIVGAIQDAIDEYYITASARLLKVVMMTLGIVLGVGMGLYIAKQFGITFVATPDRLSFSTTQYQYFGAVVIAASFALGNNARFSGLVVTGASGLLGYFALLGTSALGLMIIPANAVAGFAIGFAATVASRIIHIPSQSVINAGIVPLVPGLTLYNGLMALVANPTDSTGTYLVFRAVLIAVAIAAGAAFGVLIGRPTRRSLVYIRNTIPSYPLYFRKNSQIKSAQHQEK